MRDAHNSICRVLQYRPALNIIHKYLPENKRLKRLWCCDLFYKYWLNLNRWLFHTVVSLCLEYWINLNRLTFLFCCK